MQWAAAPDLGGNLVPQGDGHSGACGNRRRRVGAHARGQAPPTTRCGVPAKVSVCGWGGGAPQRRAGSARHLLDWSVRCRTTEVKAPRPCGDRAARRKAYSVLGLRSSTTKAVAGSKVLPTWGRWRVETKRQRHGDCERDTRRAETEEQRRR